MDDPATTKHDAVIATVEEHPGAPAEVKNNVAVPSAVEPTGADVDLEAGTPVAEAKPKRRRTFKRCILATLATLIVLLILGVIFGKIISSIRSNVFKYRSILAEAEQVILNGFGNNIRYKAYEGEVKSYRVVIIADSSINVASFGKTLSKLWNVDLKSKEESGVYHWEAQFKSLNLDVHVTALQKSNSLLILKIENKYDRAFLVGKRSDNSTPLAVEMIKQIEPFGPNGFTIAFFGTGGDPVNDEVRKKCNFKTNVISYMSPRNFDLPDILRQVELHIEQELYKQGFYISA